LYLIRFIRLAEVSELSYVPALWVVLLLLYIAYLSSVHAAGCTLGGHPASQKSVSLQLSL